MTDEILSLKNKIKPILTKYEINDTDISIIIKKLRLLKLSKGEEFCKKGEFCDKIGLLLEGLLYAHFDVNEDKPNVSRFFYTPDYVVVTNFESFKQQNKSKESIEALEDCIMVYLTAKDLEEIYAISNTFNQVGRLIAEESYIYALQRIHVLQTMNSEQRIEHFFDKQGHLYNRTSKKHLSSYLNVNRNAISSFLKKK